MINQRKRISKLIILIFFLFCFKSIRYNNNKKFDISELNNYKNLSLKLLVPSKKCHSLSPSTLYLTSTFRNNTNNNNFEITEINLDEKYQKYFITYYINNINYHHYYNLLETNGFIRSYSKFGTHNLFISNLKKEFIKKNRKKYIINKYEKIYQYIGSSLLFDKDILYKNYICMKERFSKDFNYMPLFIIQKMKIL